MAAPRITLIGGPTAIIEISGFRFLTDPTFDSPGEYRLPHATFSKTSGPALRPSEIGPIDAVLLSHDQHSDNLDRSGREFLASARHVITTTEGATRLGGQAQGLAPWQMLTLGGAEGGAVEITATPARHGPAGIEPLSGAVTGFVVRFKDASSPAFYVTGDTVWFDGVAEVALRFQPAAVVLHAGAAQTRGSFNLTMNSNDAIETAHAFPEAVIVPVHCEGWSIYTQTRQDIAASFTALGLTQRLRLLEPGQATTIED